MKGSKIENAQQSYTASIWNKALVKNQHSRAVSKKSGYLSNNFIQPNCI